MVVCQELCASHCSGSSNPDADCQPTGACASGEVCDSVDTSSMTNPAVCEDGDCNSGGICSTGGSSVVKRCSGSGFIDSNSVDCSVICNSNEQGKLWLQNRLKTTVTINYADNVQNSGGDVILQLQCLCSVSGNPTWAWIMGGTTNFPLTYKGEGQSC